MDLTESDVLLLLCLYVCLLFNWTDVTTLNTSKPYPAPLYMKTDASGNLYVLSSMVNSMASVNAFTKITPAGVVTTIASDDTGGYADGSGTVVRFGSNIQGFVIDTASNLFAADVDNNAIRKVTPTGAVSTLRRPTLNQCQSAVPGPAGYTGAIYCQGTQGVGETISMVASSPATLPAIVAGHYCNGIIGGGQGLLQ